MGFNLPKRQAGRVLLAFISVFGWRAAVADVTPFSEQDTVAICPTVRFDKNIKFALKDMEKRLICGDQELDSIGQAWAVVPPAQAKYFLRGFLQARGFHQPVFFQDGDVLYVQFGPKTELRNFRVSGQPAEWNPPQRRFIFGEALTPTLLDELQSWTLSELKNIGYPCATATTRADPVSGEVLVSLAPDLPKIVKAFTDSGVSGLGPGVLDRYNAFRIGDLYREDLVTLTRRRTQADGIVQTYAMNPRCAPDGVTILRDVILGPSRTVRLGAGGTTDRGAIVKGSVRANRIGPSASAAQAAVSLSYLYSNVNQQTADINYRYYDSASSARSYFETSAKFDHDAEAVLENQSFESKLLYGSSKEFAAGQFELRAGPTFLDSHLYRGQGPSDVTVTFLQTDLRWTSHFFEFFATSPREGENLLASILIAQKDAGSEFTAQKIQVQGEKIWNLLPFDPPLLLLAGRFNFASVFSPEEAIRAELPPRFLTFLGGDQDLRGFDPASLPRSGEGALSAATASLEVRLHNVVFRRADVFSFLDSGLLGAVAFVLHRPILMSPGLGVRYESPIGVFRVYVAQRFALDEEVGNLPYGQAYRFGLTFGQEF